MMSCVVEGDGNCKIDVCELLHCDTAIAFIRRYLVGTQQVTNAGLQPRHQTLRKERQSLAKTCEKVIETSLMVETVCDVPWNPT